MAPPRLLFLFLVLCFFSFCASPRCSRGLASAAAVASVPGFDGALPSRVETGYVTVDEENGAELFYYFIESEREPRRDPVLLWLTGGDRCSVLSALLFEIGPLKFITEPYDDDGGGIPRLWYNPYSWTKLASVLFVDSPVGAGFSFSRIPRGYNVGEVSSLLQLNKFLGKWFIEHPDYLANPLYLGGDSYAGKIIPLLAHMVSQDIEAGLRPSLNLKGYLVGNPSTGESIDHDSRVPYAHGFGIISDQLYETMMEHCRGEDYNNPKNVVCAQALDRFNNAHILYKKCSGANASLRPNAASSERKMLMEENIILKHPPSRPSMDCPTYGNYLAYFWANSNITRETLGIKKGTKDEWVRCHDGDLPYSQDIKSSIEYHRNVISKGYRALVYSGDHDAVVPFLGTQTWVRGLKLPIVNDWRAWYLDGQSAGFTIAYANNLTFATIKGGGHTAPEYQPERCFAMFKRWISNEPL